MSDKDIFSVEQIGKFRVKPLSFGKLTLIAPDLIPLVDKIQTVMPHIATTDMLSLKDVFKLALMLLPDLVPIMAKILDVSEDEIKELPADEGVKLAVTIWSMNKDIFINFFSTELNREMN